MIAHEESETIAFPVNPMAGMVNAAVREVEEGVPLVPSAPSEPDGPDGPGTNLIGSAQVDMIYMDFLHLPDRPSDGAMTVMSSSVVTSAASHQNNPVNPPDSEDTSAS